MHPNGDQQVQQTQSDLDVFQHMHRKTNQPNKQILINTNNTVKIW